MSAAPSLCAMKTRDLASRSARIRALCAPLPSLLFFACAGQAGARAQDLATSSSSAASSGVVRSSGGQGASRERAQRSDHDDGPDRWSAALLRGDAETLRAAGVVLGAGGATEINGDRAADERVAAVEIPVRDGQSALVVVRTSCGNVRLVGLVRRAQQWEATQSVPLVPQAQPGMCVRSTVLARAVALRADPAREAAIGIRWEDAMADEIHGPHLWVAGLDRDRGFSILLERAPFGGTDDRTGASTEGSLAVIDELPPPRPLFVEIRPGQRGAGGAAPSTRTVRRYELRGGRIELVDEQRSSLDRSSSAIR